MKSLSDLHPSVRFVSFGEPNSHRPTAFRFFSLRFVVVVVVVVVIVVVGFHVFGRILLLNGSENCRCGFAMDGLWSRRVFLWLEFFFYRPAWGLFGGLSLFLFLFLFVLQIFLFKNRIGKGWLKVKV